jgi:oligopeptidase B
MKTGKRKLLKRDEVVGDFDPNDYVTKRLYAKAQDGVQVPISLVHRKGLKKDGKNPLLLYGYGSYGITVDPTFSGPRLSLLERGFVVAVAHVRGGQIYGRQWYENGKLLKKKNTFSDFITCARFLISEGYSKSNRMIAQGGSAGGLLMGYIANTDPDLFKGIVAQVPFVDVLTSMLDPDMPLTTGEYDEWGDPNQKEYYDYILSYSPYDQIKPMDYPSMLVTAGFHDSQVQYWEPAKWVAKLRAMKTDQNLVMLHTNLDAGHHGTTGRFKRLKQTALIYAFMLDQVGISK